MFFFVTIGGHIQIHALKPFVIHKCCFVYCKINRPSSKASLHIQTIAAQLVELHETAAFCRMAKHHLSPIQFRYFLLNARLNGCDNVIAKDW